MRDRSLAGHLRVAALASPALSTIGTALTTLLFMPLLETVLLVVMSLGVAGGIDAVTAYAALLVAFGSTVLQFGLWQPRFWLAQIAVPSAAGVVSLALGATAVLAIDPAHDLEQYATVLILAPLACLSGAVVGIACAVLTIGANDPYLISNLVNWPIMLLTGVLLPIADYPPVLEAIGRLVPFTALVEVLRTGVWWPGLLVEFLIVAAWAAVAAGTAKIALRGWRSGKVKELLW